MHRDDTPPRYLVAPRLLHVAVRLQLPRDLEELVLGDPVLGAAAGPGDREGRQIGDLELLFCTPVRVPGSHSHSSPQQRRHLRIEGRRM